MSDKCPNCGGDKYGDPWHVDLLSLERVLEGMRLLGGVLKNFAGDVEAAIPAHDALVSRQARLDEARWWEHLVGAQHQIEGREDCEPDCMYCDRIAELERADPESGNWLKRLCTCGHSLELHDDQAVCRALVDGKKSCQCMQFQGDLND